MLPPAEFRSDALRSETLRPDSFRPAMFRGDAVPAGLAARLRPVAANVDSFSLLPQRVGSAVAADSDWAVMAAGSGCTVTVAGSGWATFEVGSGWVAVVVTLIDTGAAVNGAASVGAAEDGAAFVGAAVVGAVVVVAGVGAAVVAVVLVGAADLVADFAGVVPPVDVGDFRPAVVLARTVARAGVSAFAG